MYESETEVHLENYEPINALIAYLPFPARAEYIWLAWEEWQKFRLPFYSFDSSPYFPLTTESLESEILHFRQLFLSIPSLS